MGWFPRSRSDIADFARFIGYAELTAAGFVLAWAVGFLVWSAWIFFAWHDTGPALGNLWYAFVGIISLGAEILYIRDRLKRYLVVRRRCRCCGYDLRASTDRCPECGRPIPKKADTTA